MSNDHTHSCYSFPALYKPHSQHTLCEVLFHCCVHLWAFSEKVILPVFTTFAVIHSLIVCCQPSDLLPVFWISCRLLPAPDLLSGSLLRLACPATLSSLVLDPCLLTLINKLLQMDLTESDETQQSPGIWLTRGGLSDLGALSKFQVRSPHTI